MLCAAIALADDTALNAYYFLLLTVISDFAAALVFSLKICWKGGTEGAYFPTENALK